MSCFMSSRCSVFLALSLVLLVGRTASAVDRSWLFPSSGTFQTPTNWTGLLAPGPADTANFGVPVFYTVGFTGSATNLELRATNGGVGLNIGLGNTYTLTDGVGGTIASPSIFVNGNPSAQLTVVSGTLAGVDAVLGATTVVCPVCNGTLTVSPGAALNLSSTLTVGSTESGTLTANSGSVTAGSMIVGSGLGGPGTVLINGGSLSPGFLTVGGSATGNVTIEGGALVTGTGGIIGNTAAGVGTVTARGAGTTWTGAPNAVGFAGDGTLTIEDGATVTSFGMTSVAQFAGSAGDVTLSDGGSTWTVSDLFVGGNMIMVGGVGTVTIETGATLNVIGLGPPLPGPGANSLGIWGGGTVMLVGGTLNAPRIDLTEDEVGGGGTFIFGSGTLNLTDPTGTFTVGTDELLGPSVALTPTLNLGVAGTTVIESGAEITMNGGIFSTGTLNNNGAFTFNSGTANFTGAGGLTIGAAGPLGSTLALGLGKNVNVTTTATVAAAGLLALEGGRFTAATTVNNGRIDLEGATSLLGGGALSNLGLVTGDGQISATLANQATGVVRASTGEYLRFTSAGANSNAGQIALAGGTVELGGTFTNAVGGNILGRGTLVTGGLTNAGNIALTSGVTDVYGDVNNNTGSATRGISISGNADVTFWDDVMHAAGSLFRVSAGSSATFFGTFNPVGNVTGTGDVYLEADLTPGASPASVSFGGNVFLGSNASLQIELGGTTKGTGYDALTIAGTATLDGTLNVSLISGFVPSIGDTFQIVLATGGRSGTFSTQLLPAPIGLTWNVVYAANSVTLAVITAPALPGDYNQNGVVDGADYVVYRNTLGQVGAGLLADGNGNSRIDSGDYDVWRAHFGQTPGSGSSLGATGSASAPVPEPASLWLSLVAAALLRVGRRRG